MGLIAKVTSLLFERSDDVFRYEGRITNVHPSLLPAFPAPRRTCGPSRSIRTAGVTAHYVTTDLDRGHQRAFDVPDDATEENLQGLGQPLEAEAFIEGIERHLNDEVTVHRGRTKLRDPENTDLPLCTSETLDDENSD